MPAAADSDLVQNAGVDLAVKEAAAAPADEVEGDDDDEDEDVDGVDPAAGSEGAAKKKKKCE
jgi:hypothetical protein